MLLNFHKQQTQLELLLGRSVEEQHQRKRAAGYCNAFRPYLMAERMLNFQNVRLDVVEAVRSGKRTNFLDAPAMRRMQLAQQQQLVQDQEAQHGELERVTLFEIADREREPTEDHKEQKMMGLMQVATCLKTSLIGFYDVLDTSAT